MDVSASMNTELWIVVLGSLFLLLVGIGVVAVVLLMNQKVLKSQLAHQQSITNAILSTQEAERRRIAQDLHDELGAMIFALKSKFGSISVDNPDLSDDLGEGEKMLELIAQRVRSISHDMMPSGLKHGDLGQAIEKMAEQLNGNISINVINHGGTERMSDDRQLALYRVVSEWLSNLLKHGSPETIDIELKMNADEFQCQIKDDGAGFNFKEKVESANGLGLKGIIGRLNSISAMYQYINGENSNTFSVQCHLNNG